MSFYRQKIKRKSFFCKRILRIARKKFEVFIHSKNALLCFGMIDGLA